MNRSIKKLNYLNRIADVSIVWFVWCLSYFLRFELEVGGPASNQLYQRYLGYGVLLTLISIIVFKNTKLYENFTTNYTKDILNVIKSNLIAFIIFLVLSFFSSEERLSRIALVLYFSISTFLLIFVKTHFKKKILKEEIKVVLVGNSPSLVEFFELMEKFANYKVINWIHAPEKYQQKYSTSGFNAADIEKLNCDGVIIGFESREANFIDEYVSKLSDYLIPVMILPDLSFAKLGYSITNYKGIPIININEPDVKTVGLILKRMFDIFSCGIGLILISPLLLFIALVVKFTSKGPIFYGQVRMGVDGREFKMWKFRSMVVGDKNTEGWTVKNDPRVTPIGRFIRKTSLDELPQLWNVITGEMSLVGPRPERPVYVNQFRDEIPSYMLRHKFKAGITGWAQVNGWRGDTSIEKRIECDLWYIKNWSLSLDVTIIFLTFWKGFVNKNAY